MLRDSWDLKESACRLRLRCETTRRYCKRIPRSVYLKLYKRVGKYCYW